MPATLPNEEKEKEGKFSKHLLAPYVPYCDYLSLTFDEKLDLELKSLDLESTGSNDNAYLRNSSSDITKAIESYENDLKNNLDELNKIKDFITQKMPEILDEERDRYQNIREVERLISILPPPKKENEK